jgi:protein gp37
MTRQPTLALPPRPLGETILARLTGLAAGMTAEELAATCGRPEGSLIMGRDSHIAWCDDTVNAVTGCRRCSPGCGGATGGGCYAERLAGTRLKHLPQYQGLTRPGPDGSPRFTGEQRFNPAVFDALTPRQKPRVIFLNSTSDWCGEGVRAAWMDEHVLLAKRCPQHTFLTLTKRAPRLHAYFTGCAAPPPVDNLLLGVSVENQEYAERRLPYLLALADLGWRTFISYEPALGPIAWTRDLLVGPGGGKVCQLIVGGESGPKARPFSAHWALQVLRAGREHGIPTFIKQLGANPCSLPIDFGDGSGNNLAHKSGADPAEWPPYLRVREAPATRSLQ